MKIYIKRFNGSGWDTVKPVTDWDNIDNKPSLASASHNHDSTYLKLSGGTLTGGITLPIDAGTAYNAKGIAFSNGSRIGGNSSDVGIYSSNNIYLRPSCNGSASSYGLIMESNEFYPTTNESMSLGDSSYQYLNIRGKYIYENGTSLANKYLGINAVSNWALQSTKPSYAWNEITGKPSVATLDTNGKVPSSQLPSYVDDVLEYTAKANFPSTGETGKIYVDNATNLTYRWSGSAYVEISPSLALGTTSSTAFRGDYGNSAYAHAVTNKGSAFASGLYKITTNSEGHVTAATAVEKSDITSLGIPGSDTNTWRPIAVNGDLKVNDRSTNLNFIAQGAASVAFDAQTNSVVIGSTDTNTWRPLGTGASDACAGNDSRLSNARPASDVYDWAKASTKPSYTHNEIGAGSLTIGDGANYVLYRTHDTWKSGYYYHTTGNEAVVFANKNTSTSWIFVNSVDPTARKDWTNLGQVPAMQIKTNSVAINKLIGNGVTPSYNLDVNGTANATTLYENGTSLANKYQAKGSYLTSHQSISQSVLTANLGLGSVNNSPQWGTTNANNGYTVRWGADQTGGGGIVIAEKSGQTSVQVDGDIYVQEGTYKLATENWVNNKGYLTSHQDISGKADKVSMTAGTYKRVTVNSQGIVTAGDNTDANDNTWRPIAINGTTKIASNVADALNLKAGANITISYSTNGEVVIAAGEDTNSWRKVQLNGTDKLGSGTGTNPLNIKAGSNMTITESGGTFTFAATDTNTWRPLGTGSDQAAAGNHTHTTIVGSYTTNGGQQNPNYFGTNRVGALMMNTTVNGNSQYKDWLFMDCYSGSDVGGGVAIGVNRQSLGLYIMRSAAARSSWAESAELIGTHNLSTYVKSWAQAANKPSYSFSGSAVTSGANSGSAIAAVTAISGGSGSLTSDDTSTNGIAYISTGSTTSVLTGVKASGTSNCAPSGHTHSVTASGSVSLGSNTTATNGVPYVEASLSGTELTLTVKYFHPSFTGSAVTSGANSGSAVAAVTGVTSNGTTNAYTSLTTKYLHHSHTGASVSTTSNCAPNGHTHSVTAAGSVS